MMRSTLVGVVVVVAALAACQKPKGPGSSSMPGPGFDERQTCEVDTDCAVVEIECCDYCNGGTVVGVHRDSATDVAAEYAPASKCEGQACTEMACGPAKAICRQERCGVSIDGREQLTPLPRP